MEVIDNFTENDHTQKNVVNEDINLLMKKYKKNKKNIKQILI